MRRLLLHLLLPMLIMLAPGLAQAATDPPPSTVTVTGVPATVSVGEQITLGVTVTNTGTTARTGGLRLIAGGGFTLVRYATAGATTELSGSPAVHELPIAVPASGAMTWQVTVRAPASAAVAAMPLRALLPAVFGAAEGGVDYPGGAQYPTGTATTTNVVAVTVAPSPTPTPTPSPTPTPKNETVELTLTLTKDPFKRKTFLPYFAGQVTDDGVALTRPWCRNLTGAVDISRRIGSRRISLGAPLPLVVRYRAGACQASLGRPSNRLPSSWRGRSYAFTVRVKAKRRLSWNGGAPTKPSTLTQRYTLRVG